MTAIHDPADPLYLDEADARHEMTRVFDLCQGCRRCVDLCGSFPALFEMLDRLEDGDAGRLTPAQQDEVVGRCFQCKLCVIGCPYVDTEDLDFPHLMLRANAVRRAHGHQPRADRRAARTLGRPDLTGRLASAAPAIANTATGAAPGSTLRNVVAWLTGVSATRRLSAFAGERFSAWFARRPKVTLGDRQGAVTLFPTCLVEYQAAGLGKDLVRVYERNGVECSLSAAGCCGAPALHGGDVARFARTARSNVAVLAAEIRSGTDLVVAQPTCARVLQHDYRVHAPGEDAELVARHTRDAAEYLMKVHEDEATRLDTRFEGQVPERVVYHESGNQRARRVGLRGRDLLKLTGTRVRTVTGSSGVESLWGLRRGAEPVATPAEESLVAAVRDAGGDVLAGDCHLSNTVLGERIGADVAHPIQIVARAYGIPTDGG